MLVPKKTPFLKRAALSTIIIVLFGVIIYLVYTNFLSGRLEIIKPLSVKVDIKQLPAIKPQLATDFITREPYTSLRLYGSLPVTVTRLGQPNPFLPDPKFVGSQP
jgi:hypothetical protein